MDGVSSDALTERTWKTLIMDEQGRGKDAIRMGDGSDILLESQIYIYRVHKVINIVNPKHI
jgi:hypothetical protein